MVAKVESESTGRSKALARLMVVVAAVIAGAILWAVVTLALRIDVRTPALSASQPSMPLSIAYVVVYSLLGGLVGWGVLALIERIAAARAWLIWTIVSVVALLLSFGLPLSGTGTNAGSRVVLIVFHIVIGAIVILGLLRTTSRSSA
jgi:hypothetical protein